MKLAFLLAIVCALGVCAEEHSEGKVVQLCGAELARAVKRVCEDGDLDFLNLQQVQHHHQQDHQQNHQHDHHHDHRDHHHDTKDVHSTTKRDSTPSLVDMCCSKPCHIKDFVSYCP